MRTKRPSWVAVILVLGHLAIIAGLALSPGTSRSNRVSAPTAISILDGARE